MNARTVSGECIACLRPTDTAMAVAGSLEWQAAFLQVVGVPPDQAMATIAKFGIDEGTVTFRLCADCVPLALPRPGHPLLSSIPCITQPKEN